MGRNNRAGGPYVAPVNTADGVASTDETAGRGKYTLTTALTYVYPLGGDGAPILSAHVQWDAAIAAVFTIEDCNFGDDEALGHSTTAGDWIDEDPTTAFVGSVGGGASITNGVLTLTAGSAGGAMFHIADTGAKRTRLKVVVGGTGGVLRVACWGKD